MYEAEGEAAFRRQGREETAVLGVNPQSTPGADGQDGGR